MTDNPNKRLNDLTHSGGPRGEEEGQQPGQQQRNTDDRARKGPSQGGTDAEQDREKQNQGGQRRAS